MDMQEAQADLKVFDCNASLGRRRNERTLYDSAEAFLRLMSEAGIWRALVYNPYCIHFGTMEGNRYLLESIGGAERLVPQFVVSLAVDEIDEVQELVRNAGVKSLRIFPNTQGYPLVPWIADSWFEWMTQERIGLWIPMGRDPEVDIRDLYEMASRHSQLKIVLAGSHYTNYSVILPLLKALPQVYFDLSRFDTLNGVPRLIGEIGVRHLLFGSAAPHVDPKPYLYYLRHCSLKPSEMQEICQGNLERLLFGETNE